MIIKLYAWIPRSHVHLAEVANKVSKGINFEVSDLKLNHNVSFKIKKYKDYHDISFVLDGEGLYSLSIKAPDSSVEDVAQRFHSQGKQLLMDLIKKFHRVTYTQLIEGILPIHYSIIVLSKKHHPVKGFNKSKAGGLTIYSKPINDYLEDSFTYISGGINQRVELLCDYHAFTQVAKHFFYEMMNKMEQYHDGTKEVIHLLEEEPNSKKINNSYLNLDLVKKDAAESWSKIEQGINCLYRKKINYESMSLSQSLRDLSDTLGVNDSFIKLSADKDYVNSLWTLLINHLEYVDTAVEARINFKSMQAGKANQWLGVINSGFIIASIIIALYFISSGAWSNINNFILLLVGWIIFYEVINYVILRRKF